MPSDDEIAESVLARLAPLPVATRWLFRLQGLYLDGQYFGFVTNGAVYFLTDEETRADYLARGMGAFQPSDRPRGPKMVDRSFTGPQDGLDDEEPLRKRALRAAEAARWLWEGLGNVHA